jgi:hypothetical protein
MPDALHALCQRLAAAFRRYDAWERPLRRFRAENYRRLNQDGYAWETYQQESADLEARLVAEHDPYAVLHELFARLGDAYIAGDDAQRARIRAFIAERSKRGQLLWRFANRLTRQIQSPEHASLLTTALAALAIDNCSANYRDTQMTLADMFVAAEEAGIDPRPVFEQAAAWATVELTSGGCESLAAMLREFHESPTLRERRTLAEPYGGPT